ncbi:alternate-type signal peptide domain-containing protein [Arthrobacter citreus]|uniref:alternate-type signal peptide domain-containing protein n=2 Tax=Arthrobacter TaxID=1663 RepID=UPI001265648E|nr:alternate-type signal peptide domain-containing protein [Arthrobacter gandavensis]
MNKMAKGALAIGVGAALLLGGGGTLAVWNDAETTAAGQIAAGDLQLATAKDGAGKWTNLQGKTVDLATYKVVPGDVLTYTQKLDVKLTGDLMAAKLTMTQPTFTSTFTSADVTVGLPTLTKDGKALPETLLPKDSGEVVASASFTFNNRANQAQSSVNAAATFQAVTFKLDQVAPTATLPTAP